MSSYEKTYTRINWQNDSQTPLNATNLNKMDYSVDALDTRIIELNNAKLDIPTDGKLVSSVTLNEDTGVITVSYTDGTSSTYDTALEKIATNFTWDAENSKLILTYPDGTTESISLSSLITDYTFSDSDTIHVESSTIVTTNGDDINEEHTSLSFDLIEGSIDDKYIEGEYLTKAQTAAGTATQAATNASDYEELARSYAVGTGNTVRSGDSTDNAKYYNEQAQSYCSEAKAYRDDAEAIVNVGVATTDKAGLVKPDGSTITVDTDGTIHGATTYSLPTATSSTLGGIKVGSNLTISNGVLSATASTYTLPTATSTTLGGVKVGANLTITNGVLSASAGGVTSTNASFTGRFGVNPSVFSGNYTVGIGYKNEVSGDYATAFGYTNKTSGTNNHAFGINNTANKGTGNVLVGRNNYVGSTDVTYGLMVGTGNMMVSHPNFIFGSGNYEQDDNTGSVFQSVGYGMALGTGLRFGMDYQTLIGRFNTIDTSNIFVLGNGASLGSRSNALTINSSNLITTYGSLIVNGGVTAVSTDGTSVNLLNIQDRSMATDIYVESSYFPYFASQGTVGDALSYLYSQIGTGGTVDAASVTLSSTYLPYMTSDGTVAQGFSVLYSNALTHLTSSSNISASRVIVGSSIGQFSSSSILEPLKMAYCGLNSGPHWGVILGAYYRYYLNASNYPYGTNHCSYNSTAHKIYSSSTIVGNFQFNSFIMPKITSTALTSGIMIGYMVRCPASFTLSMESYASTSTATIHGVQVRNSNIRFSSTFTFLMPTIVGLPSMGVIASTSNVFFTTGNSTSTYSSIVSMTFEQTIKGNGFLMVSVPILYGRTVAEETLGTNTSTVVPIPVSFVHYESYIVSAHTTPSLFSTYTSIGFILPSWVSMESERYSFYFDNISIYGNLDYYWG